MADPASVLGIISSCTSLAGRIYSYTSSFKDAPKIVSDLGAEVTALGAVLQMLRKHLESQNAKGKAFERTSTLFFAVDGCNKRLQDIEDILPPLSSGKKVSRLLGRLRWPLDEIDTVREVEAFHRYAQLFEFSLTIDGFSILAESQNTAIVQIQGMLESILETAGVHSMAIQERFRDVLEAVKDLPTVASAVEDISQKLDKLIIRADEVDNRQKVSMENADRDLLLACLPSLPYDEKHRDLQRRRTSELGRWLLNTPQFELLCKGELDKNTLWCHGVPGAGKTFLTSLVIDHLESQNSPTDLKIVYFYFDYNEQSLQTPFNLVGCLLKQVLSSCPRLPTAVTGLYRHLKEKNALPGWEELVQTFVSVCQELQNVILIFDALDESDEDTNRQRILGLLDNLIRSSTPLFVTSRAHCLDINSTFEGCPQIKVEATEADIEKFVLQRISESRRMSEIIQGDLVKDIVRTIVENSQGMILLPALQIGNILSQTNENEVREALRELPSGLIQNLDLAMERIKHQASQSQTRARHAMHTLLWLSHTERTLTIAELQHALATKSGMLHFDPKSLTSPVLLIESCLGLVTIDKETSTVRLVHFSVSEYLQERRKELFDNGQATLAINCLNYLLLEDLRIGPLLENADLEALLDKYSFLEYASIYWGHHAAKRFDGEVEKLTISFFAEKELLCLWSQINEWKNHWGREAYWNQDVSAADCIVHDVSILHIAAWYGIEKLAYDDFQTHISNPNRKDSLGRTPLMLAAAKGNKSLLCQLLSCEGIDVNSTDLHGNTALVAALQCKQQESSRILMSNYDVDINSDCPFWKIPMLCTHEEELGKELARLFLCHPKFDTTFMAEDGDPGWAYLAKNCVFEPLQLLLSRPEFDPAIFEVGTTPFTLEGQTKTVFNYTFHTDFDTVEYYVNHILTIRLLENDPRFPTEDYDMMKGAWPAIYCAHKRPSLSQSKSDVLVIEDKYFWSWGNDPVESEEKLLTGLESYGLDLELKDSHGRGFLHYAAKISNEEYIKYLLGEGADAAASDDLGWTPLHWAAENGNHSITELLLDSGADVSAEDRCGISPLFCALKHKHEAVALLLLNKRAKPLIEDQTGLTGLHLAAKAGYESILKALIEAGADPKAADKEGWTVLHSATSSISEASLSIIQTLLGLGADVSIGDHEGDTPLHLVGWQNYDRTLCIAQCLLDHGADPKLTNAYGETPLHGAAELGSNEVVELLLRHKADPNQPAPLKGTALNLAAHDMNEKKIRTLLRHGGDINVLDGYGRNCGDWISIYPPLADALTSFMKGYKRTPAIDAKKHILKYLKARIVMMLDQPDSSRENFLARLGKQLIFLEDEENARIAFGISFWYTRRKFWTPNWNTPCTECDSNDNAEGRNICTTCADGVFCSPCASRWEKKKYPWCRGHRMIQIPVKRWEKLPVGAVDEKGHNFEEWLKVLQRMYVTLAPL